VTPEGRVKAKIKKFLAEKGPGCWSFWPVQTGFGRRTVDAHICYRGMFIGLEVKKPGAHPTALQAAELGRIGRAGGAGICFDDADDFIAWWNLVFP
jgi:hypothetical protein